MKQHVQDLSSDATSLLRQATGGLDDAIDRWRGAEPILATDFTTDRRLYSEFWRLSNDLISRLPPKAQRERPSKRRPPISFLPRRAAPAHDFSPLMSASFTRR